MTVSDEIAEIGRLVADSRVSSECIGIRIRNVWPALTAALSEQVVVPKEPTPEMIEAGIGANGTIWQDGTDTGFVADVANDVYRAMIAAAPPPSSTAGEVGK